MFLGPIVRITPYEIHIKDSYYWETLYTKPKSDRYDWMNGRFGNDTSVFTTSDHALHRIRRGALNPMFSRRTVNEFEPFVRQMVEDLMRKFAKYHDEDNPLAINRAWSAYAGDVVTQYSFGFNYHSVDIEDFREPFNDAFIAVSEFGHIALQYPWITPVGKLISCILAILSNRMSSSSTPCRTTW
jgi:cytochrome P450